MPTCVGTEVSSSMLATESSRSSDQSSREFRYSREDLLSLRHQLPVVICDVTKMNNTSDDLLRLPPQIMSDPLLKSCPTRALRRVPNFNNSCEAGGSEDRQLVRRKTSVDSDEEEIVYRGHPIRHSLKETQWQFKRRDDSDRSSQPLSAPSGYHAQKAENFQKFYRAVVSPTHVRVTAGGRIVPNTRAPPQPVFVWNRDKFFFEAKQDRKATGTLDPKLQEGAALRPSNPNQLPINNPITNANLSGNSNPHSLEKPLNPATVQPSSVTEQQAPVRTFPDVGNQNGSVGPPPVKLSPPCQFDTSKPFMINGQMVFPLPADFQVPHGVPVIPFNLIGNSNAFSQSHLHPSQYAQISRPHGSFNFIDPGLGQPQPIPYNNPLSIAPVVPVAKDLPQTNLGAMPPPPATTSIDRNGRFAGMPPLPGLAHQPPYTQPRFVKQKIQSLKEEIKKFDHQLEHNRHQIDEGHVQKQRFYVQSQIQTLEACLALLPSEDSPFSHSFPRSNPRQSVFGPNSHVTVPSWVNSAAHHSRSFDGVYDQGPVHYPTASRVNRSEPFHNTTAALDTKSSIIKPSQPGKTRLSLSAAKAPPFKPRSQQAPKPSVIQQPTMVSNEDTNGGSNVELDKKDLDIPAGLMNEIETRLKVTGNTWIASRDKDSRPMTPNSNSPGKQSAVGSVESQSYEHRPSMPSVQCQGNGPSQTLQDTRIAPLGSQNSSKIPYLMGFPPPGVPWKEARSHELLYTRPLTPEEVRARHLYWGNASKESQRGLPTFDGQNFYPPSPRKPSAVPVNQARYSESSTIIRKSKDSSTISKEQGVGDESQALVLRPESSIGDENSSNMRAFQTGGIHDDNDDGVSIDSWGVSKSVCSPTQPASTVAPKQRSTGPNSSTFLLGMLKNSPTISSPLSGLSSAHAVGCLPNYGGTAIPSLAPGPKPRSSITLDSSTTKVIRSASNLSVQHENWPPFQSGSVPACVYTAAELLSKVTRQNEERQGNPEPDWKVTASSVGPVGNSSW